MSDPILCPYCNENLSDIHESVGPLALAMPSTSISLCIECGEVLIWLDDGFRKPDDDELVEIYDHPKVRHARDVFLEVKSRISECTHVTNMWKTYFEKRLIHTVNREDLATGNGAYELFQDIFFASAAMLVAYIQHQLEECGNSRDDFAKKIIGLEAEVDAYAHYCRTQRNN